MTDDLLTPSMVAELLGVKPQTLKVQRMRGTGPKFVKVDAQTVLYRRVDVEAWIARVEPWKSARRKHAP